MVIGTVMIRRLKNDVLKSLPPKIRSKASLHVLNKERWSEFRGLLAELKTSNGAMGKIARSQLDSEAEFQAPEGDSITADSKPTKEAATPAEREAEVRDLEANIKDHFAEGWRNIQISVAARALYLSQEQRNNLLLEQEEKLRAELEMYRQRKMSHITAEYEDKAAENQRSTLLSRLYGLTGNVKIPLIVDMLNRWLNDPTKGKLCIFAHHLSVLDAIQDQASISNEEGSNRKFIRIDGSTLPKQRQQHIKDFQTDPSVRIALLGITAAGVAVTLTASSAVWFAELFWTPALVS
jgi:SNF2 family DNA or RNA helicase